MNDLYKEAKAAAGSWGDKAGVEEQGKANNAFRAAVTASTSGQREINPAVHYNEWANFQKEDFKPVVDDSKRSKSSSSAKSAVPDLRRAHRQD